MSEQLGRLRREMKRRRIQAYLVPSADPHQSEYVPACWKRRQYITGFSGSAGDAVVTLVRAGLWTDSRYYLQAERELEQSGFDLFRFGVPGVPAWKEWTAIELRAGEALGFDPRLISHKEHGELARLFGDRGLRLRPVEPNLVDEIWDDRPPAPSGQAILQPKKYAGESAAAKLERVRKKLAEERADAHILTQLDAIAWLFNIRGSDVAFNPVVIAYAIVTPKTASLFIDRKKVPPAVGSALVKDARIRPYRDFPSQLQALGKHGRRVWLDDTSASRWVADNLRGAKLILKPSPVALFKACKNTTEIEGSRRAHLRDGAAMVRFLSWLERTAPRGGVTELSAAHRLEDFRSRQPLYRGLSFEPISSSGAHGAVVHYAVKPETDIPVDPAGIYLIDSGSQYADATTDITRTVSLGEPTGEQGDRFTRVLKGVIALSTVSFPQGTMGPQLDILARKALWDAGLNYGHGTGHGIGSFLSVHEGPQSVAPARGFGIALEPGMILSIEPGFYKDGEYGLRTENLALVVKDEKRSTEKLAFYTFETLTRCPIDLRFIKKELLTAQERTWLDDYHKGVRETLTPLLDPDEADWLARATRPLG
jgi:Xaa-Pro aminopeptidase